MSFDQSGLPPIQLVQDAYTYSLGHIKSGRPAMLKDFQRQIERAHRENVTMLEQTKRQGRMTEDQYKVELAELEMLRDQQLKAGPALIDRELAKMFVKNHVNPAKELFKSADRATPEAMASIMLMECVRSPKDYKKIESVFGPVVAEMLADLLHIEVYTEQRKANLTAASDDVKRAYYAMTIASLESVSAQAEQFAKSNPGRRIIFPDGQEEQLFENTKAVWGVDAKLDDRMITAFNKTAALVMSKLRFKKDADGALTLVAHVPPKPPVPPVKNKGSNLPAVRKPPDNGSIGGDVF